MRWSGPSSEFPRRRASRGARGTLTLRERPRRTFPIAEQTTAGEFAAPTERPSTLFRLLRRRHFRRMWAATSVSSLGDWLGLFALIFFVQKLSGHEEFAVGGVLLFRVLPALLFAQIGGVLADRFDRRRLMIAADLSRAALIASIPWIHNLWALFGVSALMEMLSLMWTPNKDATIPNLVERDELMLANQLGLITTYGTFPISGALVAAVATIGGALAGTFAILRDQPVALAFFVDAATFCFSAAMVATLPAHLMKAKRARTEFSIGHAFRDLAEGLRFVRSDRSLRALIGGAWIAFTGGAAVISLGPIFARSAVAGEAAGARAWGSLIVTVGIGLVSGMVFAGALAKWVRRERIFPGGLVLAGVAVIMTASFRTTGPATIMTFFVGLGAGITWVTIFTLLQERVTDRLRGRTFATLYTGIHLSLFLGLAGWPLIAGLLGNHSVTFGSVEIDLSGFRICLWAGGVLSIVAGALAARTMRATARNGRVARLRGLEFGPRAAVAGGARGGLFIVFEGVEGSGKTTQLKALHHMLVEFGREVVVSREPGGTAISERVRGLVLDPGAKEMDSKTEALLYAASRAQLVAQVIRPALDQGKVVLCDRFIDSSLAYQGLARGLGEEDVLRLNMWATDETVPDLVVLLDLDPEAGLARTIGDPDRMEQEDIAFHRKVREAYAALAARYPSRFAVIDASQDPDTIREEIAKVVYGLIEHESAGSP